MTPPSRVRVSIFNIYEMQTATNQQRRKAAKNKSRKAFSKKMRKAEEVSANEYAKAEKNASKAQTKSIIGVATSALSALAAAVGGFTGGSTSGLQMANQLSGLVSTAGSAGSGVADLAMGGFDTDTDKAVSLARLEEKQLDRELQKADEAGQQVRQAQKEAQQLMRKLQQDKDKLLELTT